MSQSLRPLTDYPGVDVTDMDHIDLKALFALLPPQHIADCLGRWVCAQEEKELREREKESDEPKAS